MITTEPTKLNHRLPVFPAGRGTPKGLPEDDGQLGQRAAFCYPSDIQGNHAAEWDKPTQHGSQNRSAKITRPCLRKERC